MTITRADLFRAIDSEIRLEIKDDQTASNMAKAIVLAVDEYLTRPNVLVISGGRSRWFTEADATFLDGLQKPDIVLSGGGGLTDEGGERWAFSKGIPCGVFKANWTIHGPAGGPIRNHAMAMLATHAAIFPGNEGTADMLMKARRFGCQIHMRGDVAGDGSHGT